MNKEFDILRIQSELKISNEKLAQCPQNIEMLHQIYDHYVQNSDILEQHRVGLLNVMNERMTADIHSIRSRVKEPDHLIGKIIRGGRKKPEKYGLITADNYWKIITDLIGIRLIILDRREWYAVHQDLLQLFNNKPELYCREEADILKNYDLYDGEIDRNKMPPYCCYHAEKPIMYLQQGEDKSVFDTKYLILDDCKGDYRSIHYNIRYKDIYFEIQVRTLFEEGWLEFDHRVKYPKDQFNKKKKEYVRQLGRLAVTADTMISAYKEKNFEEKYSMGMDES